MVKLKSQRPKRELSFGTIALVEDPSGKLQMHCDIVEQDGTSEVILDRIKAAIAGLAYMYEHESDDLDRLGGAYLHGLETGITVTKQMQKKKDGEGGNGAKMGFHAKLN